MNPDSLWWRDGLYFSCVRCGACCGKEPGTVRFTAAERSEMASALGVSEKEFTLVYTWSKYGVLSLREKINYDCVFLQIDNSALRCNIYSARPAQCRTFPFWPETLKNRRSWEKYSLSCPGMNNGDFHSFEEIAKTIEKYAGAVVAKFLQLQSTETS
jgi:Fe-S-cluster containining protein